MPLAPDSVLASELGEFHPCKLTPRTPSTCYLLVPEMLLHLPGPGLRCQSMRLTQRGRYLDCLARSSSPYVWRRQTLMPVEDPLLFGHPCVWACFRRFATCSSGISDIS